MIFQTKNETETRSFEVIDMINELLPLKSLKTEEKECEEVSNREKFVLVIVTGGTLCMKKNEKGNYVPAKGFLNNAIGNISLLHDKEYYDEFIAPRKVLHSSFKGSTLGSIFLENVVETRTPNRCPICFWTKK